MKTSSCFWVILREVDTIRQFLIEAVVSLANKDRFHKLINFLIELKT
jgi:hypothetical protein